MKIFLASFLEPEKWGPGRLISIDVNRPEHLECDLVFKQLMPSPELLNEYKEILGKKPNEAPKIFEQKFNEQLDAFVEDVQSRDGDPIDLLPLEEGDTLGSWQREGFSNYRHIVASKLEKLGYEIVLK